MSSAGMAVGMGIWLLFATGTPRHASAAVLAANLPLIVSILWALVNHLSAAPALAYAIGIRRGPLAVLSGFLMVRPASLSDPALQWACSHLRELCMHSPARRAVSTCCRHSWHAWSTCIA